MADNQIMHLGPRTTLTPAMREVLELLREGYSDQEAAAELGISQQAVANRIARTLDALAVSNRWQAALAYERVREERGGE